MTEALRAAGFAVTAAMAAFALRAAHRQAGARDPSPSPPGADICPGERPRARSERITESFMATDSSVSSMPRLLSEASASAARCAILAL